MKHSTKWWIAVVAMLLVGSVVAQVSVVPGIAYRATPLGLAAAAAALFGSMVAFAIVPLVVAAITRFRWPWITLGLYVLCAGLAVVGIHNNKTHRDAELAVHQSVEPGSGIVGSDSHTGTTSLQNPSPQAGSQAQEVVTTPSWLKNAKWGPPVGSNSVAQAASQPDTAIWDSFAAEGWTQESTNSTEVGPWLNYDPPGTRYCRYADGTIQRVYPPGVRPNAPQANPFCLHDSTARVP